jgi:hypothetical protein
VAAVVVHQAAVAVAHINELPKRTVAVRSIDAKLALAHYLSRPRRGFAELVQNNHNQMATGVSNVFDMRHYSIKKVFVLVAGLTMLTTPAFAIHPDEKSEIENLRKRIDLLEAEQAKSTASEQEPGLDFGQISKYVTLHGLLEAEASYTKPDGGEQESDLTLATAELSIEATLNDYVSGHLILLYGEEEGGDDSINVDGAVISLNAPDKLLGQSASLHIGRMYLPFGTFNSYMISDPLTLELGETQNTAAMIALEGDWTLQAASFNGGTDTAGASNNIDSWVASFEVAAGENLSFGASYINDLAESANELVQVTSLYSGSVAGGSAFLSAHCDHFGFEAEYLAALEDFDAAVVADGADLTGQRPAAWNLELAWMPTDQLQIACRYEQAEDFQDDVRRYGATVSYGLYDHVVVAIEYLYADAKVALDDPVSMVTAQLALEF